MSSVPAPPDSLQPHGCVLSQAPEDIETCNHLTLCMLDNFSRFCCHLTFFKVNFFKTLFQEHYQSVKGLDPGQDQCSVDPDLSPNCLQKLLFQNIF